jgi:hypothetical protein
MKIKHMVSSFPLSDKWHKLINDRALFLLAGDGRIIALDRAGLRELIWAVAKRRAIRKDTGIWTSKPS